MKKLIIVLLTTAAASTSHAKPGGWIKDFFQGSSVTYSSGHCHQPQQQVYYERPVNYNQPAVIYYQQPIYYTQPRNVPMQPYQNFQRQGGNYYYNHCR